MKAAVKKMLKSYAWEIGAYGILVVLYFFLVLEFLGGWLFRLYQTERTVYAVVALGLIVGQGILLEMLTRWLLALVAPRGEEE
jgi:hypothetical protein